MPEDFASRFQRRMHINEREKGNSMTIRNAAKAIIVHEDKVLLVKYRNRAGETCYTIPGGGQNCLETMEEAIARECLEETGYQVAVSDFLALYEEIIEDGAFQEKHPAYAHKVFHIFLCHLKSDVQQSPAEPDAGQIGCEWVDIQLAGSLNLYPLALREGLSELLSGAGPLFLGTRKLPLPQ